MANMARVLALMVYLLLSPSTLLATDNGEQTSLACENAAALDIACEGGRVINIVSANYGRTKPYSEVCPSTLASMSTDCVSTSSIDVVRTTCQDKTSCQVNPTNSVFGDPCSGTHKYLAITYTCNLPSSVTVGRTTDGDSTIPMELAVAFIETNSSYTASDTGLLKQWKYYTNASSKNREDLESLLVWRPIIFGRGTWYQLIGQTYLEGKSAGLQTVNVDPPIQIKRGDVLGYYYNNLSFIRYKPKECSTGHTMYVGLWKDQKMPLGMKAGVRDVSDTEYMLKWGGNCLQFSVSAVIEPLES